MKALTGRELMRSPGAPSHRREIERRFWAVIKTGVTSEAAAAAVGVSSAVGTRWFRHRGGMPTFMAVPIVGRYLSFAEREEMALLSAQSESVRGIARRLGRSPSTVSRELRRNAATRGGRLEYRASVAQWKAELLARRPKVAKLVTNVRLREYVQERLAGEVTLPDSDARVGPTAQAWQGRSKPHRGDRAWVRGWSPEQIAQRLRVEFPNDSSMRISHEAIYQALYVQGRGGLERELVVHLRTGRALRKPRARARRQAWAHVTPATLLSERPAEVEDRRVIGHWEGDLLIGLNRSAVATLVERSTLFTELVHLPRGEGHGLSNKKRGPKFAGYSAIDVTDALAKVIADQPESLWRSLTWDRGKELSDHARLSAETGVKVYFADPHSPWQRGTNENTNGLLRQYFPKGTDLSRWDAEAIRAIAATLNDRPRKKLNWRTPTEALKQQLESQQAKSVATTG
jgi:IS30 family transposase